MSLMIKRKPVESVSIGLETLTRGSWGFSKISMVRWPPMKKVRNINFILYIKSRSTD